MKKLGVLLCDDTYPEIREKHGSHENSLLDMFKDVDYKTQNHQIWHCYRGEFPSSIEEADIWIISGSKQSAYDALPWIISLKELILQIDQDKKKLLGICFGHQVIHEALGGKVSLSPNGWGLGPYNIKVNRPFYQLNKDDEVKLLAMHKDQVYKMAPEFEVIASCLFCPNAITLKKDHILTFQPHPEFYTALFSSICERLHDRVHSDVIKHAIAEAHTPNDNKNIREMILAFLFQTDYHYS